MTSVELEREYTPHVVARLLTNYADIRSTLVDHMPRPAKSVYRITKPRVNKADKPEGWVDRKNMPFGSRPTAPVYRDGKRTASMSQDLHCALLDLEAGLQTLKDDEYSLILDYYILGDLTFEALAESRGLASKGRLHEKMQRILVKLTNTMNNEPQDEN